MAKEKILVTGSSGFIGYHCTKKFLGSGYDVIGIDNLNDYYSVELKKSRQAELTQYDNFEVYNNSIEQPGFLYELFEREQPDIVIHLAAQAGVRNSLDNPRTYLTSNVVGTFELLEACRYFPPKHLLCASTSSVYGANTKMPFVETEKSDMQMSFYAASKKATENIAHSYSHLFNIPTTMFRFFTVYGPWGRPDMALFKFTKAILRDEPIDVYNFGKMKRDFTYVEDLAEGIIKLCSAIPTCIDQPNQCISSDSLSCVAPFRIVNIGNSKPVELFAYIEAIEECVGKEAKKNLMAMQPGDVPETFADTNLLENLTGYRPKTSVREGVRSFVNWYRDYYKV